MVGLQCENLLPFDGILYLQKGYLSESVASLLFCELMAEIEWESEKLKLYGKEITVPRLMAWYGDENAIYRYSGVSHKPKPMTLLLQNIRAKIEADTGFKANSVMLNLYRDGQDSMGCHADNEKELGQNPVIISLSLGETRRIRFSHLRSKTVENYDCSSGDLMIMAGEIQEFWKHEIPKTRKAKSARINLTFRRIIRQEF